MATIAHPPIFPLDIPPHRQRDRAGLPGVIGDAERKYLIKLTVLAIDRGDFAFTGRIINTLFRGSLRVESVAAFDIGRMTKFFRTEISRSFTWHGI